MKKPGKLKGVLKVYTIWPFYVDILLLVLSGVLVTQNFKCGMIALAFSLIYSVSLLVLLIKSQNKLSDAMVEFAADYAMIQKVVLDNCAQPYGLVDEQGDILWMNNTFKQLAYENGKAGKIGKNITSLFNELKNSDFEETNSFSRDIAYDGKEYRAEFTHFDISGLMNENSLLAMPGSWGLYGVYMFDETEMRGYLKELHDEKLVVGFIYVDNYEDAMDSIDEIRKPFLSGLIERQISQSISRTDGIVKKLEKDKYLVIMNYKSLEELKNAKFPVLEAVKGTDIGNKMRVTVSVGIAVGFESYSSNLEMARRAIEMALSRGGDQVVLKEEGKEPKFYGGNSISKETNTKVKARVMAQILSERINSSSNVIVMGHGRSDQDSFGASIGVYYISKLLGKKANIVINQITSKLKPTLEEFQNSPDYEKDLIINNNNVMEYVKPNTLLVVVDVNKKSHMENPDLLTLCSNVMLIDHHRQCGDTVDDAILAYIETNASSASEMVTEIIQYTDGGIKLSEEEANAIYAGIVVDTNCFANNTRVRTFEAAAYLVNNGADIGKVKKLIRNSINEDKVKNETIKNMKVYKDCYAFSICKGDGLDTPPEVGAQAANEMLDAENIKASFVFTNDGGTIYVSARSRDGEVNVQKLMERIGGGGHLGMAGVQFKDISVDEAITRVKETLDQMIQEGEL